jgi:hypothetical protein
VAPDGVTFSGTGLWGDGVAIVYGSLTDTGSTPDSSPYVNSYCTWESMSVSSYFTVGGSGGGGAGGDGQGGMSSIGIGGGLAVIAPQSPTGGSNPHTHHASWSDLESGTVVQHLGFVASANDLMTAVGFQPAIAFGSYATTWTTIAESLLDSTDSSHLKVAVNKHSCMQLVDALFAELLVDLN